MPLVVFLRGVNVGGHKTFRPTIIAKQLKHLDAINIGATGTFVIRQTVTRVQLRAELFRLLPFHSQIIICSGKEIAKLMTENPFVSQSSPPDITPFVSILSSRPRFEPPIPMNFPPCGRWLLKILSRRDRFIFGFYRRDMKVISYLGQLDRLFGVPVTTRSWSTIKSIAKVLDAGMPVSSVG